MLAREGKEPNMFEVVDEGETPWTREGLFYNRAAPVRLSEGRVQ